MSKTGNPNYVYVEGGSYTCLPCFMELLRDRSRKVQWPARGSERKRCSGCGAKLIRNTEETPDTPDDTPTGDVSLDDYLD